MKVDTMAVFIIFRSLGFFFFLINKIYPFKILLADYIRRGLLIKFFFMRILIFFFFEFEDSFLFSNFGPEVPFHDNCVNEENYREERNNDEEQFK